MEQQQLKTHPKKKRIDQNQSETALKKCTETVKDIRKDMKQCELINNDLEEKIAQHKTAERSKEKRENSLISILGKSKKDIEESDSSNVILRKMIDQGLIAPENDLKHSLTQAEELKRKEENKPGSVQQELLNKDRNKTKKKSETYLKKQNNYIKLLVHKLSSQIRQCDRRAMDEEQSELVLNSKIDELWEKTKELQFSNDYLKQENYYLKRSKSKLSQILNQTEQLKQKAEKELGSAQKAATEKDRELKETMQLLEKAKSATDEQKKLREETMVKVNLSEEIVIELRKETATLNKEHDDLTISKEKCETRYDLFLCH